MSVCHLHILITNKTAADISESFREEGKLRHAQTSPSDGQRAPVTLCATAARRSGPAAIGDVPERSRHGAVHAQRVFGGGGAGRRLHWGKSKGKLDGTINYNI